MNSVLRILRKTESKLEKQVKATDTELSKIRAAIVALAGKAIGAGRKRRRKMSAATKAKMSKAAKLRWSKVEKKS